MIGHEQIAALFNTTFRRSHQTILIGGVLEPRYEFVPDGDSKVYYREDFPASALHEAAHWCLAGPQRRKQDDYGYWYEPQRDTAQQLAFEQVERRPQALEWVFSVACGLPFKISADNLDLPDHDISRFRVGVHEAALALLSKGLPPRAARFADSLSGGKINYTDPCYFQELPH